MTPQVTQRSAIVIGQHRYRLDRLWDASLGRAVFICLNPSTADAVDDDQTVRRMLNFAQSWGFGSIAVVNLFAWRSTFPRDLIALDHATAVGPHNDAHIGWAVSEAVESGGVVVAAWGSSYPKQLAHRVGEVRDLVGPGVLHCLDVTGAGDPRHPSRLAGDLLPVPWPGTEPAFGLVTV